MLTTDDFIIQDYGYKSSPESYSDHSSTDMKLSIIEYMKYIGGSEHSKCVVEGENVLNARHLILAGKIQESSCSEYMTVYGLCLQTSALDSNPHEITGKLLLATSVKISSMLCTCKAGNSGKCKHVSAFLIRCIREDVETLSAISQTDKKCVWASQRNLTKEKYRPVPVAEIPCFSGKIKKSDMSVDSNNVLDFFCRKLPISAIAKHREGRREEPSANTVIICTRTGNAMFCEEILNHACQSPLMMYLASYEINIERDCCLQFISALNKEDVDIALNIPQHSIEWERIRKYRITGSRCYEIYSYSKEEWKTKSVKYFHPIAVHNKYTKHGLKYESMARDIFIEMSKMTVVECGLVIPVSNKWLGYSPDGIIFVDDQPLYLLEIKCIFEDCVDFASDEDFLTQLSADLDIPLLLNPGEDEMSMLNAFFDKSPEEIMSDIKSPVFAMEDILEKEMDELGGVDISKYGPEAFPNLQPNIKAEPESSDRTSNKSKSPSPDTKILIKDEIEIKSSQSSPESVLTTISELPAKNIIYTQPLQLLQNSLKQLPPKRVPIVPKPPYTVPFKNENIVVIKTPVPVPVTTATNMVFLENVPQITTSNSQASGVPVTVPSVSSVHAHKLAGIDPKVLKRQQRKIRNRESASLSRKRKKDYITQLEEQIKALSDENKRLKEENINLKKRLGTYEVDSEISSKSVKPGLFLCICLLVIGANINFLRTPFSTKTQLNSVQSQANAIDHHGRSLLWTDEDSDSIKNSTYNFSPLFMCPATVNQTETARLVSELERWIGKPEKNQSVKNATMLDKPIKLKLRKKRLRLDESLIPIYKRYRYKEERYIDPTIKNEIQVFSLKPKQTYSEFFEAINRQDDTYYVVSFTDQHMLLPALNHNKTRRPKMSLIMPSVLPNGTFSQTELIPLMQIDCEVLDTKLIHVKHESIPQHLRGYSNDTKKETSEDATSDKKYYKRPYKPYFVNKNILKPNRGFLDVN